MGEGLLIANGWYMHTTDKFPPPGNITPIYVSVHLASGRLLEIAKIRAHFRQHAPIGCRDMNTVKEFLSRRIPAYYSGCLTTTCIPRGPINRTGEGELLLVDNVHHPVPGAVKEKLETVLRRPFVQISHDPPLVNGTLQEYSIAAEKHMNVLLERYCKAALVVTTKIHCALPCLGMGVNVMLIHPIPNHPRLNPVREFMEVSSYEQVLRASSFQKPKINQQNLRKRQAFLEYIVRKSIEQKKNVLSQPDIKELKRLKLKSILLAQLYASKRQVKAILKG
jgi:hypothetical protein